MTNSKARYWKYNLESNQVDCFLCPHFCNLSEGKIGICKARKNICNTLHSMNYGKVTSTALDPIEKKPLYHFKPGTNILSFGTFGCNMSCHFCQNYQISQQVLDAEVIDPSDILELVKRMGEENNTGIAFTYNEPFIWYEYMFDVAKQLKEERPEKSVVVVTNGYINPGPLAALLPYADALNIDLKSYQDSFYRKLCGASVEPVLKTIELAHQKVHVEVTTLMIPGENDSFEEIEQIAKFLSSLDPNIPLHLSRYFPNYKMTLPATDIIQIRRAKDVAKKYLNYVYLGNIASDENTYCPKCNELLIERNYYKTKKHLKTNVCPKCGEILPIIL